MWTHRPAIYSPVSDSRHPTAVWRNLQAPNPKLLRSRKVWDDRCVDTGQVLPAPLRPTIVSRKMLSADDPGCTVVVVQSHPYESGSDLRTPAAAPRRSVQCTADTFCRAERAHRGERGEVEEQRVHFAVVCGVSPPLVTGQTKLLLEL